MKRIQKRYRRIYDITPELIKDNGIKGLLVDMDNTLLPWHETNLSQKSIAWLNAMKDNHINICIITNSGIERTGTVMKDTGYDFIYTAFKPFPFSFIKGRKKLNVSKKELCIVGDQMMTDALGANIYGCGWIIVNPMSPKEQKATSINRFFERIFFRRDVKDTYDK